MTKSPFCSTVIALIEECPSLFSTPAGAPIPPSIEPSLKLISELGPSIAPTPRIRSVLLPSFALLIASGEVDPCCARVLRLRRGSGDRIERKRALRAAGTATAAARGDHGHRGDCGHCCDNGSGTPEHPPDCSPVPRPGGGISSSRRVGATAMAVAAAPCEERDGRWLED